MPTDITMRLPPGKTCGDCVSFKRCLWLFQCNPFSRVCDFSPSRFVSVDESVEAEWRELVCDYGGEG